MEGERMRSGDVTFLLPWNNREFLRKVAQTYKENCQITVCSTCCKFDCSRPSHNILSGRDYIINSHMRYVKRLARHFSRKKYDDLAGEALLEITKVLTYNRGKIEPHRITGFIHGIAINAMKYYTRCDKVFGPKTSKTVEVLSFTDIPDRSCGNTVDLDETINKCCDNAKKLFIATCLKEGGWSVQDMADELEISVAYIGKLKSELESDIWTRWYNGSGENNNGKNTTKRLCCLFKCNGG